MDHCSVELIGVSKVFGQTAGRHERVVAVDEVSFQLRQGELLTLLGPSGCGKTTTLRMVGGFELPSAGRILLDAKDISNVPPNHRDTAMVFQSYALFPHMTVQENVAYGLQLRKMNRRTVAEKVRRILGLVGLEGLESRPPGALSGGQQQRVALARALVVEPSVLLMDEPLSNLDAKLRTQMRVEIRKIQQELNITSIYVTHDQEEAMSLSDRIAVMNKGRIEQIGSATEVYARPGTRFVADFMGKKTSFLDGECVGANEQGLLVRVLGVTLAFPSALRLAPGRPVELVVRPEAVDVGPVDQGTFVGRVSHVSYLGSQIAYEIKLADLTVSAEVAYPLERETYDRGTEVGISLRASSVHLLPAQEAAGE